MNGKVFVSALACVVAAHCMFAAGGPWLKGVTDKSPLEYKSGETMTFTLTLERAADLPSGLFVEWLRTGDDGKEEKGSQSLERLRELRASQ